MPTIEDTETVAIVLADETETNAAIKRSRRAKHIRITVTEDARVVVSAPKRVSRKAIKAALAERIDWLTEHMFKMRDKQKTTVIDLHSGGPVRLHGQWLDVTLVDGAKNNVNHTPEKLIITLAFAADPYDILEGWMRQYARDVFTHRAGHWGQELDLAFERITIRDQKTRWGSCSTTGTLSFNWRLIMAPLWVMDAIIVHELCHIREMNHSKQFWDLLNNAYPEHDRAQQWLTDHGALLRITPPEDYQEKIRLGRVSAAQSPVQPAGDGASRPAEPMRLF